MPKYTQKAWTETVVSHYRVFTYINKLGWEGGGFSFPSDKNGKVDLMELAPIGRENYLRCIMGITKVRDDGVAKHVITNRHRACIECIDCGRNIGLYNNTNTCECGADYNMSGQRLAPREQWGWETGEHWTECY